MIPKTLPATRAATFSVMLPSREPSHQGFPLPTGTGFFVSGDGYFVTAMHVLTKEPGSSEMRDDLGQLILDRELDPTGVPAMVHHGELVTVQPALDVAVLKFDIAANADKKFLQGADSFPQLQISNRVLDEGEPVYAFGYPLGMGEVSSPGEGVLVGHVAHGPRVTSAIIASKTERTGMVMALGIPPETYVLDKALNYGNSGGPIVSTETGRVHAVCRRFQPVYVPQNHLADASGNIPHVMIPSLYGVASNLGHPAMMEEFRRLGVQIASD